MSGFPVGPFGRTLPSPEDSTTSQESQDISTPSKRLINYQLPPPRKTSSWEFVSDDSPAPLEHMESPVSMADRNPTQYKSRYPVQDQLPPVSQLLTPVSYSYLGNPHRPFPGRGNSPPNSSRPHESTIVETHDERIQPSGHPSHETTSRQRRPSTLGPVDFSHGQGQNLSYSRHQLPPISQVGLDAAGLRHHLFTENNRSSSETPLAHHHHSHLPYPRDPSNSETSPASGPSSLSCELTFRSGSPPRPNQPRLAHVVDERFIEGEGICYIYSDGTHCPKVIDGEPVNANWGVTKAGKPRKRLAQACFTCRDKKIKCIPNIPKCDQCQKSGRECRFENSPRGNQIAKSSQCSTGDHTPAISLDQRTSSSPGRHPTSCIPTGSPVRTMSSSAVSCDPGALMHEVGGSSPKPDRPLKRRRRASTNAIDNVIGLDGDDYSKQAKDMVTTPDPYPMNDILSEMAAMDLHDPTLSEWETDPYHTHPESTMRYLNMYFHYVNGATYCIFPREPFLRWLKYCPNKSLDDKMLLYSMLAMGAIFGNTKEQRADAMRFARIARHAVEKSQNKPTLHLAQTRIILGMWHFTIGASATASDFTGSAMRTICGLKLNVEHGSPAPRNPPERDEFFQAETMLECQRRTFWAAFLMDRHAGPPVHSPTVLKPQDIFLRLPLRADWYENQKWANMPYFENGIIPADTSLPEERNALDPMAFLVEVSAIWGDVLEHIYRATYISPSNYAARFEEFYSSTVQRTDKWLASLPRYFSYSVENMELNIQAGKVDVFASVHILYHATMMRLNRYVRHPDLPEHIVERNVRRSYSHSVEVLRIAYDLSKHLNAHEEGGTQPSNPQPPQITFSTPLTGNAILSATDVLCACGSIRDMSYYSALIHGGLRVISEVSRFWHGSREQLRVIEWRLEQITDAIRTQDRSSGKRGFSVQGRPLDLIVIDRLMPANDGVGSNAPSPPIQGKSNPYTATGRGDLVYCLPRETYFHALGLHDISVERGEVLWIPCEE
ncbi:C6 transcription factor [Histoplasma capsulatum var. duboisii H88]|uniref:C6 transcription factor n=1 Tax=Ajellomyces capsulatus (strain H88) TaxID=544711 RepID=F0UPN2_AJEC8|nr:C6 transcription factor [Histoplasma capsulatum var. duboisii H88]QSS53155.1 C6 transcription factor [Histoplasma capsulatum var. duboisii H88]